MTSLAPVCTTAVVAVAAAGGRGRGGGRGNGSQVFTASMGTVLRLISLNLV